MSNIEKVFNAFNQGFTLSMHTSFPAIVVSYNEEDKTADVQPIYKLNETKNYPQILDVPVMKFRYKIKRPKLETEAESSHTHSAPADGGTTSSGTAHKHTIKIDEEEVEEEFSLFLKKNDIVLCVCCERSIDDVNSKKIHLPQSERRFDLSDAVIVGILY